ncbi:ectoine synthase, partial [Mycobacterium tuberculosis]
FNPPVTGTEVHDENGAYPAEASAAREPALAD